ncbi:DUF424 domain-containing protein [Candidatus Woesearchaeota archaeon]|nr:DUF424 domain-containing protein [Candidatus Woesearchaeota archaeon]
MRQMIVNIHKTDDGRRILAVCDIGLIGRRIEQGKLQLDLTSDFYRGTERDADWIRKAVDKVFVAVFIGGESVEMALKMNLILEKDVLVVDNVPYTQCIFL